MAMNKTTEQDLLGVLENVDLKKPATVNAAVSHLLEDEGVASTGATVILIDDTGTYPAGTSGKVKGVSSKGLGYVDVELPDSSVIPVPSNLLLVRP